MEREINSLISQLKQLEDIIDAKNIELDTIKADQRKLTEK
jgi:hypothetical protein